MKLRKFKKQDAEKCSKIIYSCVDTSKKTTKKDREYLKKIYTPQEIIKLPKISDFFVVTHNKKIIGMGRLEKSKIATVYFDPKFHRKRGGTLIMSHLEKLARKKKLKRIYLESLLQSTGFYKKLGFKKKKFQTKPIRSWKMEKRL
jgi:N-acetylglutamate synthase-like GNAT family acetyltransferase